MKLNTIVVVACAVFIIGLMLYTVLQGSFESGYSFGYDNGRRYQYEQDKRRLLEPCVMCDRQIPL
jgi:hypothetical protein